MLILRDALKTAQYDDPTAKDSRFPDSRV